MSEMLQDFKKWTVICIVACLIALLCVVVDTGMHVYKEYFTDGCETEYVECENSRRCGCIQCRA